MHALGNRFADHARLPNDGILVSNAFGIVQRQPFVGGISPTKDLQMFEVTDPLRCVDINPNGIHLFWRFCLLFGDAVTGPTLNKRRHTMWGESRGSRPYGLNRGKGLRR